HMNPTTTHCTSRFVRRLSAHPPTCIFHFSWDCPLLGIAAYADANSDKPKLAHATAATLSSNPNHLHIAGKLRHQGSKTSVRVHSLGVRHNNHYFCHPCFLADNRDNIVLIF